MATICIDPGHGGKDPGATFNGRKEADDTLRLALKVREYLVAQGVKVIMTRTGNSNISINERTKLANDNKCDYYLSIHRNSAKDSSANGYETWVYSQASTATVTKAKTILDAVAKATGGVNRGVKKGAVEYDDYGVNKYTNMPATLLECGFIGSTIDNNAYDKYLDKMAQAIAKALCSNVGVKYSASKTFASTVKTTVTAKPKTFLNYGDKNLGVYIAKQMLIALYEKGIIKTKVLDDQGYGLGTKKAVIEVQKLANIEQDGLFGASTAAACRKLLSK